MDYINSSFAAISVTGSRSLHALNAGHLGGELLFPFISADRPPLQWRAAGPRGREAPPKCTPESAGLQPGGILEGLWILAVDDDPDARRLISLILTRAGARVTTASGSAEALELLPALARTQQPGVLVSDLAMPEQDGFDFIRKVRAAGYASQRLPAVAVTAFAQKSWANATLIGGYQAHLAKPVDPNRLVALVASLAGRAPGQAGSSQLG